MRMDIFFEGSTCPSSKVISQLIIFRTQCCTDAREQHDVTDHANVLSNAMAIL